MQPYKRGKIPEEFFFIDSSRKKSVRFSPTDQSKYLGFAIIPLPSQLFKLMVLVQKQPWTHRREHGCVPGKSNLQEQRVAGIEGVARSDSVFLDGQHRLMFQTQHQNDIFIWWFIPNTAFQLLDSSSHPFITHSHALARYRSFLKSNSFLNEHSRNINPLLWLVCSQVVPCLMFYSGCLLCCLVAFGAVF